MHLALDGELTPRQCWSSVVIVSGEEPAFVARHGDAALDDGERVQRHLVWEPDNGVSLRRSVAAARDNARSIREVLSAEVWQTVNELHLWIDSPAAEADWRDHRDGFYRRVREATQLALGLLRSTMLHDTALDFVWLGMLLERIGQTARLLDVHHHALVGRGEPHRVVETAVWLALLRACSGVEPFMKSHAGRVTGAKVASFLLREARFPRSIAYCARSAFARLGAIRPPEDRDRPGAASLARLGALAAWLEGADMGGGATLHEILTHVVDETAAICDTIGEELLGYPTASIEPQPQPQPPSPSQSQSQS
jgi:uncharacterized alpha-E superfamily protein